MPTNIILVLTVSFCIYFTVYPVTVLIYPISIRLHKDLSLKSNCVRGQFVEAIEVNGVGYRAAPGMHWLNNSYDPENFEEVDSSFKLPLYCIGQIVNDVVVESDKFEKDLTELVAREILDIIRKVSDEKYVLIKKV